MQNNGQHTCGAKTRSGSPCNNPPVKGGRRCRMHGGKSLKGTDSPTWKHGLYSKYAGESLKEVLAELEDISTEELIQPEQEIRLMAALIMKCKGLNNGLSDMKGLDTLSKVIERLITAKQRSQAIMIEQQRLIPAKDVERFLDWMEERLIDRIGREQGSDIMDELQTFRLEDYAN